MKRSTCALTTLTFGLLPLLAAPSASAAWAIPLASGSTSQGASQPVPPAPTGVTSSCQNKQIKVTWNAVNPATTYTVLQSLNSGGYTAVGTVTAPTTSWSSGPLSAGGTYVYAIEAVLGANWFGATSTASAPRTIITGPPSSCI